MTETKKDGLLKRLFSGKKDNCCGVKIEEIKEEGTEEKSESMPSSGCCSPEEQKAQ
jgi:hypothetical protein